MSSAGRAAPRSSPPRRRGPIQGSEGAFCQPLGSIPACAGMTVERAGGWPRAVLSTLRASPLTPWPGVSRPSRATPAVLDGRLKAGHDGGGLTLRGVERGARIPTVVIPAKAGTQSTGSGLDSAAASRAVANAARAFALTLVWVPAGSLTLARRDDVEMGMASRTGMTCTFGCPQLSPPTCSPLHCLASPFLKTGGVA
jgi:hypothetical protein